MSFRLHAPFKPQGDQPKAIAALLEGLRSGVQCQTLLGITGSGKTFTIANVIEAMQLPTLVISPNKTLAAQLYSEFREFFPENAVEYFISYYDYYQPEAYIPQTDTYIEKDASVNDRLDRLRLSATTSLLTRRDVIVVASVSCIYNLGDPVEYGQMFLHIKKGQRIDIKAMAKRLVEMRYERNDAELARGRFQVRGDSVFVLPAYYADVAYRISFWGEEVDEIAEVNPLTKEVLARKEETAIYAATHFLTQEDRIDSVAAMIENDLEIRLKELRRANKLLEAQRLEQRTRYDIEMIKELGYCPGIENYSRYFSGRPPGSRPMCLFDYFPRPFLLVIDESHITIPQIGAMYKGDKQRKDVLIEHGFRLPSCLDNRPLRFDEFEALMPQTIFVSATPAEYEIKRSNGIVVEQIIRPTGLLDPKIETRVGVEDVFKDMQKDIETAIQRQNGVIITTLTKRLSEDIAEYLKANGIKARYIHSDLEPIERVKALEDFRKGEYNCLVGINLLREGLDLPEVELVIILDADKIGFLRSERSLFQIAGRAARNVNGRVIMYADAMSDAMSALVRETDRRRRMQEEYNRKHKITARTIQKGIRQYIEREEEKKAAAIELTGKDEYIAELERQMDMYARNLQFEKAAQIRDAIKRIKGQNTQGR